MSPLTTKTTEEGVVLGAMLLLLLIVPAGITVGLRTSLAILFTLIGFYLVSRGNFTTPRLLLPLLAWVSITLGSALWSWDPQETLRSAAYDALLPVGAMLAAWHLARRNGGTALWIGVLVGAPLVAITGIGVITLTGTAGLYEPALRQGWLAAYPGVGVSTTIAVLVLPFCLAGFLQELHSIRVMSAISLGGILAIGLVSQNRAVWPALAITGGIQALLLFRRQPATKQARRTLQFGALFFVVILVAGWFFTQNSRMPDQTGIDGTVATVTRDVRWAAWEIWAEKGAEHPILGFGYGKRLIPVHIEPPYRKRLAAIGKDLTGHAHNLLLNVWLQTGILGVAILIMLFASLTKHLLISKKTGSLVSPSNATIGLGVLVGLLAKNMTDDFFGQALALYFWLLMGIALGLHEADIRHPPVSETIQV